MADLGHLGPYGLYRPWDSFGPFWPNSNEVKRVQRGSPEPSNARWVPNHKWAHLSLFCAELSEDAKPQIGPRTHGANNGLWKSPEATSQLQKAFSHQYQVNHWARSTDPCL
ncbi:hypothetical protein O181_007535 [Austropuccinia psidii MF-1]|uniref:Uncharacterized protein n=1 Tax=Austropuccinia psidii MF-1 TaxID=1389203 RepID=A0A9Q3BN52_9BASI|nr:hypothetical protein [Austropuccinia psidii MF-1]